MFKNLFKKDKRSTIVYAREKKVDKDFTYDVFFPLWSCFNTGVQHAKHPFSGQNTQHNLF